MDDAIKKSITKDIKNLKINYIDIQNFKNIEYISTELYDWNIIGGWNGEGKSSFLHAILTAIQGHKFFGNGAISPTSLVQNGEDKATIKLLIKGEETEIIIERVFTKGTAKKPAGDYKLKAEINGEKISQTSLDKLLNSLTLDPLALGQLSKTEQIKEIKDTIGLDTTDIDARHLDQEESTKESRATKVQTEKVYESFGIVQKVDEVSVSALLEDREILDKKQKILDDFKRLKAQKEQIEEQMELARSEGQKLEDIIEERELGTLEEINLSISNAETINDDAREYKKYIQAKNERDQCLDEFKKEEEKLKKIRSERTELIANSNIPEYMEISEDYGILVDKIEYKLLNTARKIEVAIDLILISGSPLRMIRIEQGGELDTRTLEAIKPKIIEHGFQIFIERAIIDKYDSIIISDGEIIEDKEDFINNQ